MFGVSDSGFGTKGLGLRVYEFGCMVSGLGSRFSSECFFGFGNSGYGFTI
jgi:hypothetical protein